jgi:hypothetical protein
MTRRLSIAAEPIEFANSRPSVPAGARSQPWGESVLDLGPAARGAVHQSADESGR